MTTATMKQLVDSLVAANLFEDVVHDLSDDPAENCRSLFYFTQEMRQPTIHYLRHIAGFSFADNDDPCEATLTWDEGRLAAVRAFSTLIHFEYEAGEEVECILWAGLDLRGDEDSDYNGSYINCLLEAIDVYMGRLIKQSG
jgi:hypothetical protein